MRVVNPDTLRTQWRRAPRNALAAPGWDASAVFKAMCSAMNSSKLGMGSGLRDTHEGTQIPYASRSAAGHILNGARASITQSIAQTAPPIAIDEALQRLQSDRCCAERAAALQRVSHAIDEGCPLLGGYALPSQQAGQQLVHQACRVVKQ